MIVLLMLAVLAAEIEVQAQLPDQREQRKRMQQINPNLPGPLPIDAQRVVANGIEVQPSKHLDLYTDLKGRPDIDELTVVFDAAVAQWCEYFDIKRTRADAWRMKGMVIADRPRFVRAGLIPGDLPDFLAGFQRGHEMWVYLQRGNYYTRHLLLHEGTHAFMQWFLGGTGAPWYTEGMAELLAVHRWQNGQLTLNHSLRNRQEAEYWGRIKIVQDDCRAGKTLSLEDIFNFPPSVFREVRYYAWSWAACEFLSRHPLSDTAFARWPGKVALTAERFNQHVKSSIRPKRAALNRDWKLFVEEIEFGYDVDRGRLRDAVIAPESSTRFIVQSGCSWQATSIQVQAGQQFEILPEGQFIVANRDGTPWPCESGGVTIEYYRGNPLGCLMVAVLADEDQTESLVQTVAIGKGGPVQFDISGTICLRINESPSAMSDNEGQLVVTIEPSAPVDRWRVSDRNREKMSSNRQSSGRKIGSLISALC